jgi:ankyrin repeat protein
MGINPSNVAATFASLQAMPILKGGFQHLVNVLLLTATYRHNELQSLVDLTFMFYSGAAGEAYRTQIDQFIKAQFMKILLPVPFFAGSFGWYRYIFLCLTQLICTRQEIVDMIETFEELYPGCVRQLLFMASWFLADIKRLKPKLFERIETLSKSCPDHLTEFPIYADLSDLDAISDLIHSVYPYGSLAYAIRTNDLRTVQRCSTDSAFSANSPMPSAYFGCYSLMKNETPTLIEAAAFFGSTDVFRFLLITDSTWTLDRSQRLEPDERERIQELVKWACAGGKTEIIRLCVQKGLDIAQCLDVAVLYHQHDIVKWILSNDVLASPREFLDRDFIAAATSDNVWWTLLVIEPNKNPFPGPQFALTAAAADSIYTLLIYLKTARMITKDLLNRAAESGASQVCHFLLTYLKSVARDFTGGMHSLYAACAKGFLDIVEFVIETGKVDINAPNSEGFTPLMLAAQCGHLHIVRFLLSLEKIDITAATEQSWTAIHYAASAGHVQTVKELLKSGKLNMKKLISGGAAHPAFLAVNNRHIEVLLLFLSDARFSVIPEAFIVALEKGFTAGVEAFLNREPALVRIGAPHNRTALHCAVRGGEVACVSVLLKSKLVEVNREDEAGQTPLHYAAIGGHAAIVSALVADDRVKVNPTDRLSRTPLHFAAENGHFEALAALLGHAKIAVNVVDCESVTPLHLAVEQDHVKCVKELLKWGEIDVNCVDKKKRTPLYCAAEGGNYDIVFFLRKVRGIVFNLKTGENWTVLHAAARGGHDDILTLLLPYCKSILNARTSGGWTALHFACIAKHLDSVRVLILEDGIELNVQDGNGVSFLFIRLVCILLLLLGLLKVLNCCLEIKG